MGLAAVSRDYTPTPEAVERYAAQASSWVVAGTPEAIAGLGALGWADPRDPDPVLTDDFADLLRLLRPLR